MRPVVDHVADHNALVLETGIEAGVSGASGYSKSEAATAFVASSFVNTSTYGQLNVNVTPEKLQEYLTNVIVSALALNTNGETLWQTDSIPVRSGANVYAFNQRVQFYTPYGACLIATLLIYALGLRSLYQNGVSAGNSFLQHVSASRISDRLDNAGIQSSRGGDESFSDEFKELELQYGIKRISTTQQTHVEVGRLTGFGTVDEIELLDDGLIK